VGGVRGGVRDGRRAEVTARRVSVAIPPRGRTAWCLEAVASALAQEDVEVEVVVAMDGEQPDLRAALAATGDERVKLLAHATPRGRSAARNLAVSGCTSPLVAFLDDDDVLLPDGLAARADALDRRPTAALAYGRPAAMDASGRASPARLAAAARGRETCRDRLPDHLLGRSVYPSTALLRRATLARARGFDEDLETGEDWLFFLRACAAGPFVFVPRPTVLYRRHAGQSRGDPAMQERALPVWTARWAADPDTPAWARARLDRLVGRHKNWIARAYRAAGDEASARRLFREAARLDPTLLLHPRRLGRWLGLAVSRGGGPT
jgi:glycosyltransferase involved in cell wall biosynthesis